MAVNAIPEAASLDRPLDELDKAILAPLMRRLSFVSMQNGVRIQRRSFENMSPEMREQLLRMLRQVLRVDVVEGQIKQRRGNLPIALTVKDNAIDFKIADHVVTLENLDSEAVSHLFFAQEKEPTAPHPVDAVFNQMTRAKIKESALEQATPHAEHLKKNYAEVVGLAVDFASIARNTLSLSDPLAPTVTALGFAGGTLSVISGLVMASKGKALIEKSQEIGDREGANIGAWSVSGGLNYATVGAGMVLDKVSVAASNSAGAATLGVAAGAAINACSLAMYGSILAQSLYEMKIAASFGKDFHHSIAEGGVKGGLAFLKKQLCLTPREIQALMKIEDLGERHKALQDLHELKWARFTRRTDNETLLEILPKIKSLSEAFESDLEPTAAQKLEAVSVLEAVAKANFKRIVKLTIMILIGLAGLAVTTASIVFYQEVTLPCILFASMSSFWIVADSAGLKGRLYFLNFSEMIADGIWHLHKSIYTEIDQRLGILRPS